MAAKKFHSVVVMTCQKGAFPAVSDEIENAKKDLAEAGIKLVVIRHSNNSASPRFESFRVE